MCYFMKLYMILSRLYNRDSLQHLSKFCHCCKSLKSCTKTYTNVYFILFISRQITARQKILSSTYNVADFSYLLPAFNFPQM
jgi:hypothetical protein